ncbi:MAG: winged helix-turn-helix transcriptional regulator [Rhodospirillales bacterium]|nr:winged helix-turn-helix transcriptional regulator [Rhodospirillales bacterium]
MPSFASIGALLGVPARANILAALIEGRALTATELALYAGVSPQTTSTHLAKLMDAGLITVEKHGRHRFFRLADPHIADILEPLSELVVHQPVPERRKSRAPMDLRPARICYDHLAGNLGVQVADALKGKGYLEPLGGDFRITDSGTAFFAKLDIDLAALARTRRVFARQCLDWSERRPHLGGVLGATLCDRFLDQGWIKRTRVPRQIIVLEPGERALKRLLGIKVA